MAGDEGFAPKVRVPNKKIPTWDMAGDEGFEPPNGGTRTHCLTTWRIPNDSTIISYFLKNGTYLCKSKT